MVAELHGKISSTGSNLSDRMEDKLTGDIFGSLRFLPFSLGIGPILSAAVGVDGKPVMRDLIEHCNLDVWVDRISFWPDYGHVELDAQIDLDNAVIGIEVKYRSPLSSDDTADYSHTTGENTIRDSENQLSKESRTMRTLAGPDRKGYLLLVANEADCKTIVDDVRGRNLIEDSVTLGYVSWQRILYILERQKSDDPVYTCILNDTAALLRRKGFDRFRDFDDLSTAAECFPGCAYEYR